jgi:uncharacterized protein (TIGR02147 family)
MDYAYELTKIMSLSPHETEYYLLLVQYENSSIESYRQHIQSKIQSIKIEATQVKHRVSQDVKISEQAKAQFYSHWHYSAIRLATDIPDLNTPKALSENLGIELKRVSEILEFLVTNKLVTQEGGKFSLAASNTHLDSNSPWIYNRQLQWRLKSIQSMESPNSDSLYYTGPMVLSLADRKWIREKILELIKDLTERARGSSSQTLACLNIDWFEF